jgi:glycerol-3-phosphate acyltransferase PlsY
MLTGVGEAIQILLAAVLGYLLGAIPTGVLVSRAAGRTDVRDQGSGHTGGLNVSRTAGVWGGVLTGVVDMLLGVAAVVGALWLTGNPWAATAAGVMAVVGHNWSVFIRFAGGIGLSSLVGALLGYHPLLALIALPVAALLWVTFYKLLDVHRARTTILVMLLVGPLLWVLGLSPSGILLGAAGGLVVALKTLPDWNREYDRDATS